MHSQHRVQVHQQLLIHIIHSPTNVIYVDLVANPFISQGKLISVTPFPLYNIKQSERLNQCNTKHAYPKGFLLTTRYSRKSSVREERTMGPCRGQIAAVTRASPGPVISEKRTDLLIEMFNFDNMLDSRNFTSVYMERHVQKKVSHLK